MHPTLLQRTCALGAVTLALCVPAIARAGDPSPEAMEKSSALYQQARALQVRGQWAEAEAAYQSAWDLRRTFDIAGNLGDCELHVGQPREAAEHLSYALKNLPAGVLPEQTAALKRMLQDAQAQIGTLHVAVNLPDAHVLVDGHAVAPGELPFELFVDPGPHTLVARRDGYVDAQTTITARAGSTSEVPLVLRRSFVPGAVLGGIAGAALVAGVVLEVLAAGKRSSEQGVSTSIQGEHHTCVMGAVNYDARCPALIDGTRSSDTLHDAGVGVLAGAGAAALGTAAFFLWQASAPTHAVRIAPAVSVTSASLILSGTFQ